ARELGFNLDEVRALLGLADARDVPCSEVKDMAIEHREDIKTKIADLRRMQKVLDTLITQCQAGDQPGCPLIETLFRHTNPSGGNPRLSPRNAARADVKSTE
ncbi:MAG: MerR family DNA-binding protein, partial [Proteobacteria bacterium]|nr:MerR family DNA-binding protein [Pseudomonadota bacterium]